MSRKYESPWLERQDSIAVTVVRLKTPSLVDEDAVRAVFDPINAWVGEVGRIRLVLNLAAVEDVGHLFLAKLVTLRRKVQAGDGRLALCQLQPAAQEVLEITRLTPLFNVYATEQEAVQFSCESRP
jgi:anti-anti-sigma factor